jgi:predicted cupin superfamily sugar epimerase
MKNAQFWIKELDLLEHPEGGYFKETYRSLEDVMKDALPERFPGSRRFSTAIYFLLTGDQYSHFHRIKSDELWHFHTGSSITLHMISPEGEYSTIKLGPDVKRGEVFQAVMPAAFWFGTTVDDPKSFTLVGCTVAPGFDFEDFELGDTDALLAEFPMHEEIIRRLT